MHDTNRQLSLRHIIGGLTSSEYGSPAWQENIYNEAETGHKCLKAWHIRHKGPHLTINVIHHQNLSFEVFLHSGLDTVLVDFYTTDIYSTRVLVHLSTWSSTSDAWETQTFLHLITHL